MQGKLPVTPSKENQKWNRDRSNQEGAKVHAPWRRCRMLNNNDKLLDVINVRYVIRSGRLEGQSRDFFAFCGPEPELNNLPGASDI